MIGNTISHYRVTSKLGQGGMGEVYRAEDTKLGRDVALKMLPDEVAEDRDRLARFEREARVLAALSHPNIAAIYDLVEVDRRRYLVMEVAEGEDLSAWIARGPLPLERVVAIGLRLSEALEAAHEKNIVHRDLKPANVKVDAQGRVKILDFGLAKALAGDEKGSGTASSDIQDSPTLSKAMTAAGMLLGTVGYMSPEQARGQSVDRRADIWAFGCILFEMLTGRPAFPGQTVTDVIASVVQREPDLDELPRSTPPSIKALIRACLKKDPTRRLQAIGDARITLQEYLENPTGEGLAAEGPSSSRHLLWLATAAVAGALVGAAALYSMAGTGGAAPEPVRRFDVRMGDRAFDLSLGSGVVLSPKGNFLAYVTGTAGGETQLWLRPLGSSEATLLAKGSGAAQSPYHPFFSPDEKWLGYVTASELRKISVTGGTPMTLAPVQRSRGASWGPDDTIVYAPSPSSGLYRVPAGGGEREPITTIDESKGEATHRWPQWLPGGKAILFTSATSSTNLGEATLEVVVLATGERKQVHRGGYYGRYAASGHLLYAFQNTLFAVPFDVGRLETTGTPVPVVEGIAGASAEGTAHYDVSDNGLLAYLTGEGPAEASNLVWVTADGGISKLWNEPGIYGNPRLSPDGTRLALSVLRDNNWDVWVFDLARTVATRLTFHDGYEADQVWSPDGRWLAYASDQGGPVAIYRKRVDGTGEPELLGAMPGRIDWYPASWSSDGRWLLAVAASNANDIFVLPLEGDSEPAAVVATPFTEEFPVFSPDTRFIAYDSNESGRLEVYVRTFPKGDGKWQVSDGGGAQPRWSRDGKHLFYRTEQGVDVVDVESTEGGFRAGRVRPLIEGNFHGGLQGVAAAGFVFPDYDPARDGRFVMLTGENAERPSENWVTLVTGWFQELDQLAPPR